MRYRATFQTTASITVEVEVPEEVLEEHAYLGEGYDEQAIEDWVSEKAHDLATEHINTWGTHIPVLLDTSIDGIGAETVERIEVV